MLELKRTLRLKCWRASSSPSPSQIRSSADNNLEPTICSRHSDRVRPPRSINVSSCVVVLEPVISRPFLGSQPSPDEPAEQRRQPLNPPVPPPRASVE